MYVLSPTEFWSTIPVLKTEATTNHHESCFLCRLRSAMGQAHRIHRSWPRARGCRDGPSLSPPVRTCLGWGSSLLLLTSVGCFSPSAETGRRRLWPSERGR
jgi:hypothetical protein